MSCNGGSQNRKRPNAEPRFGGKACPHYTETRPCGMVACGCNTRSGFKAHGAHYAGFGKNYCNQCRCHSGTEVCTKRECGVHSSAQICASTTCKYGIRFGNTDEILSTTQAISAYGAGWASMGHEMTTLVKHDHRDANGGIVASIVATASSAKIKAWTLGSFTVACSATGMAETCMLVDCNIRRCCRPLINDAVSRDPALT